MRLRHRIKLQAETQTADAVGHPVATWSTYRTCWSDVRDVSAAEKAETGNDVGRPVTALVATLVTLLYPHDGRAPIARDRVLYEEGSTTRTLHVSGVRRVDGTRRLLELTCTEDQREQ